MIARALNPAIDTFLAANGWAGAHVTLLAADSSFRRYFRVSHHGNTAVLMDAPPDKENCKPFLAVDHHLAGLGLRVPKVYAADLDLGLALLEDFGDNCLNPYLVREPSQEYKLYTHAVHILAALQSHVPPVDMVYRAAGGSGTVLLPHYDSEILLREVRVFIEWFLPATDIRLSGSQTLAFETAWAESLAPVLAETKTMPVMILRDYHADNLMVLDEPSSRLGLIDFQDALCGHPAYDVASLLLDIRRTVSPELEAAMLDLFVAIAPERLAIQSAQGFLQSYHILAAQRNTKIIGIFTRLCKRDGKPRYLGYLPRLWLMLERSLGHPALAPVAAWFDQHIPQTYRKNLSL